jgi:phosphoenolpyruvate synthase/pyruvate phosphate dikinase
MQTMKLYAQIRWTVLRLAKLLNISNEDVFWLRFDELKAIAAKQRTVESFNTPERKAEVMACLSIDLPQSFSFEKIKRIMGGEKLPDEVVLQGSQLSGGLSQGRVHIVIDPDNEDLEAWDENTILVAESTDPSWTALFARCKGIVVARGGVLSHCAIVAREMGRPAVGEIQGATHILKEGEYVWVDGTHGIVRRII